MVADMSHAVPASSRAVCGRMRPSVAESTNLAGTYVNLALTLRDLGRRDDRLI